ncbi:hypothetical protein M8C21_026933 [Ambrosia artemisiifolia]|uniref:Uncharacterized protein n=1 Tax=Ambrosia artemisiifolia TaxID=4212 RepID=A0AAD5G3X8_AMBAR|nr:hypothetical protein M8C21_026933 [Ambrosia artemisiifolia]
MRGLTTAKTVAYDPKPQAMAKTNRSAEHNCNIRLLGRRLRPDQGQTTAITYGCEAVSYSGFLPPLRFSLFLIFNACLTPLTGCNLVLLPRYMQQHNEVELSALGMGDHVVKKRKAQWHGLAEASRVFVFREEKAIFAPHLI